MKKLSYFKAEILFDLIGQNLGKFFSRNSGNDQEIEFQEIETNFYKNFQEIEK